MLQPPLHLNPPCLTFLGTDTQQVDNVLMSANQLHHLHLRDQVCQVLVRGIVCKDKSQGDYTREAAGLGTAHRELDAESGRSGL